MPNLAPNPAPDHAPAPGPAPTTTDDLAEAAFGLADAGAEMAATGLNPVTLAIGTFDEDTPFEAWTHYPSGDARDTDSGLQIYYHAHREDGEHGHFHVFLRAGDDAASLTSLLKEEPASKEDGAKDDGAEDTKAAAAVPKPIVAKDLIHVVAITMDPLGLPVQLFTTNYWVTGEQMITAEQLIPLLGRLRCSDAFEAPLANRWFNDFFTLYRDDVAQLLHERDAQLDKLGYPLEDREVEILSSKNISILDKMDELGLLED